MKKTKILLVIAGLPAGGAERQMALLSRGLDRDRFEVGLLIFGREVRVHYRDVFDGSLWFRALNLDGGAPRPVLFFQIMMGIRKAVKDFQPDLVHASLNVANHMVRATKLFGGIPAPVVTSVRNDFETGYRPVERLAERILCRLSQTIISNAQSTTDQLRHSLPLSPDRLVTIENGIDPVFFSDTVAAAPDDWPVGGPVALCVGRFTDQKNHLGLLAALAQIDKAGGLGDWRFVIVGEGPLEGDIRRAAVPLGERVCIFASVDDLLPFYRAADVLLLPSRHEGLSNVALEAQAAGCPVAITKGANAAGPVEPGCGWVIDGDLVEGFGPVLASTPEVRRDLGEKARADVKVRFGVERMENETQAVYEKLIDA